MLPAPIIPIFMSAPFLKNWSHWRGYNVTVAMTMLAVINFHESIFTERNRSTTSRKWFQLPPVTVSRQVMKYGHESFGKVSRNQLIATIRRVSDVASRLHLCPRELSTEEAGEAKKERPGDWMPIRVTEIENGRSGATGWKGPNNGDLNSVDSEREEIALKVEGTLYRKEAELLERICRDLASQTRKQITLELSNLSFLDSDSAAVLCLLKRELGVSLEGLHLFIGKVVELAEESEKVDRYRPRTGISTDSADYTARSSAATKPESKHDPRNYTK